MKQGDAQYEVKGGGRFPIVSINDIVGTFNNLVCDWFSKRRNQPLVTNETRDNRDCGFSGGVEEGS